MLIFVSCVAAIALRNGRRERVLRLEITVLFDARRDLRYGSHRQNFVFFSSSAVSRSATRESDKVRQKSVPRFCLIVNGFNHE